MDFLPLYGRTYEDPPFLLLITRPRVKSLLFFSSRGEFLLSFQLGQNETEAVLGETFSPFFGETPTLVGPYRRNFPFFFSR